MQFQTFVNNNYHEFEQVLQNNFISEGSFIVENSDQIIEDFTQYVVNLMRDTPEENHGVLQNNLTNLLGEFFYYVEVKMSVYKLQKYKDS